MKKVNVAKVMWVGGGFLLLIVILLMVMDYKINYQYLKEMHLYFYECNGNLCIYQEKQANRELFSEYDCDGNICPEYNGLIEEKYALLKKSNNTYILFDYKNNVVLFDGYNDYRFINDSTIIVTLNNKMGIMSLDGKKIADVIYDTIGYEKNNYLAGYNNKNIIVSSKDKYGIISYIDGSVIEELKYSKDEISKLEELLKQ